MENDQNDAEQPPQFGLVCLISGISHSKSLLNYYARKPTRYGCGRGDSGLKEREKKTVARSTVSTQELSE